MLKSLSGGLVIEGTCHCEQVKWSYELALESVTACNCTLCSRYGALWAYGFLNQGIKVSGPTSVYMRGRQLSGYHFCSTCGCLAYYLAQKEDDQGQRKIAVNTRMIKEPDQIFNLPIDHFDGRYKFEDLPRDGRCIKDLWF